MDTNHKDFNIGEKFEKRNYFTLYDFLLILYKYKKLLLIFSLIALISSSFISFVILDPIYQSNAIVKASEKSSGLEKLLSGGGLLDVGDFGELAGTGAGGNELALFEQIISSRTSIESLITRFDLLNEYNYKYMYDAVKYVKEEIVDVTRNKMSGTLSVGMFDKNPQKAKEMLEFLISELDKTYTNLNVLNAKNNREFLEKRYAETRIDLTRAEDSLKNYQDKYGVLPDVKVKAAIQTQVQLEATLISEEVKLDLLKKMLSKDQPEVKEQENKILLLREKVDNIKNESALENDLYLNGAPDVIMGFLRLQRNVEIQNKILTTIIPLYEQARIQEKKDTPSLLIIDQPNVPDKKTKPKRLLIVAISVFLAFVLFYIYFFIYTLLNDKIRNIKQRLTGDHR